MDIIIYAEDPHIFKDRTYVSMSIKKEDWVKLQQFIEGGSDNVPRKKDRRTRRKD